MVADLDYWNPVISWDERSFSHSKEDYLSFWKAMIDQAKKIWWMSIYFKHFPWHGDWNVDTHNFVLEFWEQNKEYLEKNISLFNELIEYGKEKWEKVWIMVGHMVMPNEYKKYIDNILENANYILTDDLGMKWYKIAHKKKYNWKFLTTDYILSKNDPKVQIVNLHNTKSIL